MNKILIRYLCLFAILLFTGVASAHEEDPYTYIVETYNEVTITSCDTSLSGDIIIPNKIGGYPVTSIAKLAFSGCDRITSITVPDTVSYIDIGAFEFCSSLKTITLPKNITDIGYGTFYECSSLTDINIPHGVTSIDDEAFAYCTSLPHIYIPDSVVSIGKNSFTNCQNLKSVHLGSGMKTIGNYAFSGCISLLDIAIPDGVLSIGLCSFDSCTSLKTLEIPNSVTTIGARAFSDCSSLTDITVGSGITYVDRGAFESCNKLENVHIRSITDWCKIRFFSTNSNPLYYADNLYEDDLLITNLTLTKDIPSVGQYTFCGYIGLKSVTITQSSTTICTGAFYRCSNLTDVYFYGSQSQWNNMSVESSNTPLKSATPVFLNAEKSGIYENGTVISVIAEDAKVGNQIIIAFFDNGKFIEAQIATYKGNNIVFTTDKAYTDAKVMVWDDLASMSSVCDAETILNPSQL